MFLRIRSGTCNPTTQLLVLTPVDAIDGVLMTIGGASDAIEAHHSILLRSAPAVCPSLPHCDMIDLQVHLTVNMESYLLYYHHPVDISNSIHIEVLQYSRYKPRLERCYG